MTTHIKADTDYDFTERTRLLIAYYEDKLKSGYIKLPRERFDNRIRWVNELIISYDKTETDYNERARLENSYKDYKTVCATLDTGKIPTEVKRTINPKKYKKVKRCNVKQIARTIHLLKVAKRMGRNAFEKFILTPDVSYILRIIKIDSFGDLKYLNISAA